MSACSQLRGLVGAHTHARHLHRVMITDDTNSHAWMPRGVPRNPHHHMQMRAPTPTPRPAAAAAGKFNSAITLLRDLGVWSRLQRRVTGASGSPYGLWANQSNFPAAVAAPQPCAPGAAVLVCAEKKEAQGLRLGLYGPRDGGWGWVWWWGEFKNKIHAGRRIRGTKPHAPSVVPGSNPPGQKRRCPGRRQNTGSVSQWEGRT
jgi:hypothetical protein